MKKIMYTEIQFNSIVLLLNKLKIKGIKQAKIMKGIADILDDAEVNEIKDEVNENREVN